MDGGLFGWGDHKVTGSEMNNFIGVVQDKLISVNSSLRNIISEFKEVYNAFDILDKEYINGILGSVESAENASMQALKAQDDIKTTVDNLKKTVVGLVSLKMTVERIEEKVNAQYINVISYEEVIKALNDQYKIKNIPSLVDTTYTLQTSIDTEINKTNALLLLINSQEEKIDAIWNDIESQKINITNIHQQVDDFIPKVNQTTERINNDIAALRQYRMVLESYEHLGDVDAVWSDVEEHKTNLAGLHQQVDDFIQKANQTTGRINNDIAVLQQYRMVLESYEHLGDVDAVWSDVEEHKTNLAGLHQQVDDFIQKVNQTTGRINNDIAALQQYRMVLESYEHLGDVDAVWSDVEEHKTNLAGLHQQIDNFISEVHTTEVDIKASIQKIIESNTSAHLLYDKKIKVVYCIGSFAIILSAIHLTLQIFGVL